MRTLSAGKNGLLLIGDAADGVATIDCAGRDMNSLASLSHRFGLELYERREAAGLTPAELARRSGLTRGYYSRVENSKCLPPPSSTVARLCQALNLSRALAEKLQSLAYAERVVTLLGLTPGPLARIVCGLAEKECCSTPGQMQQVYKAIEEAIAM